MNDKVFETLSELFDLVTCQGSFEKGQKCYDIIEEALTTKSKKEQALEIIVKKDVDVDYIKNLLARDDKKSILKNIDWYNKDVEEENQLTQEEYDLLKEVLENED